MTGVEEELLVSPPSQQQSEFRQPQPIHIECRAEQRHFVESLPMKIQETVRPIRLSTDDQLKPGRYRSEIIVHNTPDVNLYIKRLRVAFNPYDPSSADASSYQRSTLRSQSTDGVSQEKQRQQMGKYRSVSLPRANSQAILHRWIDDICSNEKLMNDDDICFFLKNGEFLARI